MKVGAVSRRKMDAELESALAEASTDELVRAVIVLARNDDSADRRNEPQQPSRFSSRDSYRKAMISRQRARLSSELSSVKVALQKLGLKVRGGDLSRALVVEGPAQQVVRAVGLPGVRSALLDRQVKTGPRRATG